ncbi:MAG TPA: amidohydrolase family protein, partial [Paenirhodobacter sp.]
VPLAFGTDWPTAPLSPFNAIHAAMTRQPWAMDVPDQRIPFDAVIDAYTLGGAYALFAEGHRGQLVPGMVADLTLIAGDLPRDIAGCRAVLTLCDGRVIHNET